MIGSSRIEEGGPVEIQIRRVVGKGTALIPCMVYSLSILVPIPARQLTVLPGASFGPALAAASIGLGHILCQVRKAVTLTKGDSI
jgi:hypothetical protein